ncbi:YdcF family protein [Paraburkholderia kururiensis]|uniref:YdcF family protein n=2 Tax=Paraburkholderia kururiensis TaxID=984307 RepID=A0ABZ0WU99_9BURK|nr:YdcF family protein [Paraburkholderia kururiensis]WQD80984.1 YdcF family protein [Paraburkholderia kururiensis]
MLWRSARRAIAVAAAALFWLFAAGWLAQPLLDWAQPAIYRTPYDLATTAVTFTGTGATVIVMLGSGTEFSDDNVLVPKHDAMARIVTVSKLYRRCHSDGASCRVIVSGGNPQRHPASEADTYLPYLLALGVARNDIALDNTSLNTYQNARNVGAILQHQRYDSLMLVTSAYQMPRAMLDFHRFGYAPQPVVSNVRHAKCGWLPRLSNLAAAETALHELVGIAQFHVYRRIGWF